MIHKHLLILPATIKSMSIVCKIHDCINSTITTQETKIVRLGMVLTFQKT